MHMALSADEWLKLNTSYCHRHLAWIGESACQTNQRLSSSDLRCAGCNGLYDQPEPVSLRLAYSSSRSIQVEETEPAEAIELEIVADPDPGDDGAEIGDLDGLNNLEIDFTLEQLEALCPGLSKELAALLGDEFKEEPEEAETPARRPCRNVSGKPHRVAVYMGRCRKCGGYMLNALERREGIRDDEVYKCHACGWRTSPGYEWNRNVTGRD
jgi:hypothetical protein